MFTALFLLTSCAHAYELTYNNHDESIRWPDTSLYPGFNLQDLDIDSEDMLLAERLAQDVIGHPIHTDIPGTAPPTFTDAEDFGDMDRENLNVLIRFSSDEDDWEDREDHLFSMRFQTWAGFLNDNKFHRVIITFNTSEYCFNVGDDRPYPCLDLTSALVRAKLHLYGLSRDDNAETSILFDELDYTAMYDEIGIDDENGLRKLYPGYIAICSTGPTPGNWPIGFLVFTSLFIRRRTR